MPHTFWNLSNHPIKDRWSETQISAAKSWGGGATTLNLVDLGFPAVDPDLNPEGVARLAKMTLDDLVAKGAQPGDPVHVMGELTLVHALVLGLKERGCVPLASTTLREAVITLEADGTVGKKSEFRFRRFRAY